MTVGINGQPSCCERCLRAFAVYAWNGVRWVCESCRWAD